MKKSNPLVDKSLLIIFTYAPAGLGHLRVTDALYDGLPKGARSVILQSNDAVITILHRFISIHYITRMLMEFMQKGIMQDITTMLYRFLLRSHTKGLKEQLLENIQSQSTKPKTVLVVATHFGQAHQLDKIKLTLERLTDTKILLVVQVTDDSPQHLWYVPGADMIFVPSMATKKALESYGASLRQPLVPIVVSPYPLSPSLKEHLSTSRMAERVREVEMKSDTTIHVAVPISGAAVGLSYVLTLMKILHTISSRFVFHIIAKKAPFTLVFLQQLQEFSYVHVRAMVTDREVIAAYEELYQKEVIALEITKPSEQSFKALLDCENRGASLLLFTQPIGRQEDDNLNFLMRHKLIPQKNEIPNDVWMQQAALWRGISLPQNPKKAAQCIWWCLEKGIFSAMMSCKVRPRPDDLHISELSANGMEVFWKKVGELVTPSISRLLS